MTVHTKDGQVRQLPPALAEHLAKLLRMVEAHGEDKMTKALEVASRMPQHGLDALLKLPEEDLELVYRIALRPR